MISDIYLWAPEWWNIVYSIHNDVSSVVQLLLQTSILFLWDDIVRYKCILRRHFCIEKYLWNKKRSLSLYLWNHLTVFSIPIFDMVDRPCWNRMNQIEVLSLVATSSLREPLSPERFPQSFVQARGKSTREICGFVGGPGLLNELLIEWEICYQLV